MSPRLRIWSALVVQSILAAWVGLGAGQPVAGSRPTDALFATPTLSRISIRISAPDAASLDQNPRENVPALITWNGKGPYESKVRLKGGEGSFRPLNDKPALTLNFGGHGRVDGPFGLHKAYLNNSVEDPSLLAEDLGSEFFRRAGVPAPGVAWAVVEINGRRAGVYVIKEAYSREFLEESLPPGRGNIYECGQHQAGHHHDVGGGLELSFGDGAQDGSDLAALAKVTAVKHGNKRWQQLSQWVDAEEFASFMAAEILVDHFDGYSQSQNNFHLFFPSGGRAKFLPTGMDRVFTRPDAKLNPRVKGEVAVAFVTTPAGGALFRDRLRKLASEVFDGQWMTQRIDAAAKVITPADPALGPPIADLRERVIARAEFIRRWLEAKAAPSAPPTAEPTPPPAPTPP